MGIGQTVQSLGQLVGSQKGLLSLLAAVVLLISAPVADRYLVRRKRIGYRVEYNSKIGLSPIDLHDTAESSTQSDPRLRQLSQLLHRMSIVIIRIRNNGSADITANDFEIPLSFEFGRREIWDARVSEAMGDGLRDKIRTGLQFFPDVPNGIARLNPGQRPSQLSLARSLIPRRLAQLFDSGSAGLPPEPVPTWHGVRLTGMSLKRREQFKLVVVLREEHESPEGESHGSGDDHGAGDSHGISKDFTPIGRIEGGSVRNEQRQRRFGWPAIAVMTGVLLAGVLIASLIIVPARPGDTGVQCAAGSLRIEGSSAFAPIIGNIATEYGRTCAGAGITTRATGSIDGVRTLGALPPADSNTLAVLSDGRSSESSPQLVPQAVAVIVYAVVINRAAGIDRLTSAQLRDIYQGRYTDWQQLRPGPSLPISIVGRGQESGTRQTFERKVLATSEGVLSSDACQRKERLPQAPTIRCERSSTAEVISETSAIPGAIGYADAPAAKAAAALATVPVDGHLPDIATISQGYPFWTIEYLYTKGVPKNDALLKKFIDFLRNGAARAELSDAGYTPCVDKDGQLHPLCVDEPS